MIRIVKKLAILSIAFMAIGSSIAWSSKSYAATFGDQPLTDVLTAAQNNLSASGITRKNEFAAIIIAPTYPESADSSNLDKTPIPMALGRSDISTSNGYQLWVDGKTGYDQRASSTAPYRRVHWNAGIGLWQLDGSGLGQGYSLKQAIYTDTAASKAAARMASLYSSAAGTASDKRKAAWKPWFGCGSTGSTCESIFNTIYTSSTDTLNVTRNTTVTRSGGLLTKSCQYGIGAPYFTCYKYDPGSVQGSSTDKNVYWLNASWDGGTSLEPLPKPFYSYTESNASGTKEQKHWLTADTGYSTSRYSSWDLNSNPRGSVIWYSGSSTLISN